MSATPDADQKTNTRLLATPPGNAVKDMELANNQAKRWCRCRQASGITRSGPNSGEFGYKKSLTAAVVPMVAITLVMLVSASALAEDPPAAKDLPLRAFRPQSMLRVRDQPPSSAKFAAVDIHTHFGFRLRHDPQQLKDFVQVMDRHQIAVCVSLDGRLGESWHEHADYLWSAYRDRFVIFVHVDWKGQGVEGDPATWDCHRPDFARRTVAQIHEAHRRGASGLKIFKRLGLSYRNPDGTLLKIDDPRWDPIWKVCGQLGMPVIIHTADPAAFFLPADKTNERWEELSRHPEWSFHGPGFPARDELLSARNRVIARHPETTFIGAHLANNPEDLNQVGQWLARYPNLVVGLASRIGELGRQPVTARKFLTRYADRVLLGTDGPWPAERLSRYWQFLETEDEYFPYSEKSFPPQGFWNIYGVALPDHVLRRIYENAARIIPGVAERLERWQGQHPERSE